MIRIVGVWKTSVVANLAEWHVGGSLVPIGEDLAAYFDRRTCFFSCFGVGTDGGGITTSIERSGHLLNSIERD
jgi:hypothetical protein